MYKPPRTNVHFNFIQHPLSPLATALRAALPRPSQTSAPSPLSPAAVVLRLQRVDMSPTEPDRPDRPTARAQPAGRCSRLPRTQRAHALLQLPIGHVRLQAQLLRPRRHLHHPWGMGLELTVKTLGFRQHTYMSVVVAFFCFSPKIFVFGLVGGGPHTYTSEQGSCRATRMKETQQGKKERKKDLQTRRPNREGAAELRIQPSHVYSYCTVHARPSDQSRVRAFLLRDNQRAAPPTSCGLPSLPAGFLTPVPPTARGDSRARECCSSSRLCCFAAFNQRAIASTGPTSRSSLIGRCIASAS